MENWLSQSNIVFFIGIMSLVFTVYRYFRDPQITTEKISALMSLEIKNVKDSIQNLKDNHIHTLETKVDGLSRDIVDSRVTITKLATIIDERIPKSQTLLK